MADVTQDFFRSLAQRGRDGRLTAIHEGSVRFDINRDGQTDHWLVSIAEGGITSRSRRRAGTP
ncbi:hypothetical protein JNW88_08310 [Micromonospora sp. ATA32]|nr:hypothetical protein [Micromonospora sp. ATA32]